METPCKRAILELFPSRQYLNMKSRASPREDLPIRLRSMSQASQETLVTTQFARDLTKHSADVYLRLTVLLT